MLPNLSKPLVLLDGSLGTLGPRWSSPIGKRLRVFLDSLRDILYSVIRSQQVSVQSQFVGTSVQQGGRLSDYRWYVSPFVIYTLNTCASFLLWQSSDFRQVA